MTQNEKRTGGLAAIVALTLVAGGARANPPGAELDTWNVDSDDAVGAMDCIDQFDNPFSKLLFPQDVIDCQLKNNCYNYGTNKKNNTFAQPGAKGGGDKAPVTKDDYTDFLGPFDDKCQARTMTEEDYCALGDQFMDWADCDPGVDAVPDGTDIDPTKINDLGEGKCLVALYAGCITVPLPDGTELKVPDYHWLRQNADAKWSHKPGSGRATDRDNNGNEITDPSTLPDNDNDDENDPTDYDKFVGYMVVCSDTVNVCGFPAEEGTSFFVDVPAGQARLLPTVTTEIPWGWMVQAPDEIQVLNEFLTDLPVVPDPEWNPVGWEYRGVEIQAEPGVLQSFTGFPLEPDAGAVAIRAWDGVIRIDTQPFPGAEVQRSFYADVFGLEQFLLGQAPDRTEAFPGFGSGSEPCLADCNDDGVLNVLDFICFQQLFESGDAAADCNNDDVLNVLDFICFQGAFEAGCP